MLNVESLRHNRTIVLGCAGFVGSHLVDKLLQSGCSVIGVDNFYSGAHENLETAKRHESFELKTADVREFRADTKPIDVVLHLASPASPKTYLRNPIETLDIISNGSTAACELALSLDAHLIHFSSSEVYGQSRSFPQSETDLGLVDTLSSRACYSEAKRFSETIVDQYTREKGLHSTIIRLFNVYGERMSMDDGRVIPEFMAHLNAGNPLPIHGDGMQTRSFCHVSDAIRAIVAVVDRRDEVRIVNIGNPEEVTIMELARKIGAVWGQRPLFEHLPSMDAEPLRRLPDIGLLQRVTDWSPFISLGEGLRMIYGGLSDLEEKL